MNITEAVSQAIGSVHALNFKTLMDLSFVTDLESGKNQPRLLHINGVRYPLISLIGYKPLTVDSVQVIENGVVRDFNKQTGFNMEQGKGTKINTKNTVEIKPAPKPKGFEKLNSLVSRTI